MKTNDLWSFAGTVRKTADGGALMHDCVFTHAFMHIYKKTPHL